MGEAWSMSKPGQVARPPIPVHKMECSRSLNLRKHTPTCSVGRDCSRRMHGTLMSVGSSTDACI